MGWEEDLDNDCREADLSVQGTVEHDHRVLLPALWPNTFTSPFEWFQDEFWQWVFALRDGQPVEKPLVYLIFRGGGKSTSFEAAVALLAGLKNRRHALYIGGVQDQADEHVSAIRKKLIEPSYQSYYPHVGAATIGKISNQIQRWSMDYVITASGFTVHGLGLDAASRGAKAPDDIRPDIIFIDDVDDLRDSLAEVIRKKTRLTRDIIPTLSTWGTVCFGQNVIHGESIANQLSRRSAGFLLNARVIGPIKAIEDLKYKTEYLPDDRGVVGEVVTVESGKANWSHFDLRAAQWAINHEGLDSFLRESQHEIERPKEGASFRQYSEAHTVISWTQFAHRFGKVAYDKDGIPRIPPVGSIAVFQDVGTTKLHPCVTLWLWRPEKGMGLEDTIFVYRELVLPEYPNPLTIAISPLVIGERIHELERPWNEAALVRYRLLSHEATTELNAYKFDIRRVPTAEYPEGMPALNFDKWNAARNDGIALLQSYFTVIEKHVVGCVHRGGLAACPGKDNPFKPGLEGRTRIVFVVADDQILNPYDCRGLNRLRAEIVDHTDLKLKLASAKVFDDACFVAGTLISTDQGPVPIENVQAGDRVLTRKGYRPVLASGLTRRAATCYKLRASNDIELIGTGNHPVWADGQFVPLAEIVPGSALCVEKTDSLTSPISSERIRARLSSSTGFGSIGTPTPSKVLIGNTFSRTIGLGDKVSRRSIKRFGRAFTARFLKDTKFTIKTATLLITRCLTWSASQRRNTLPGTSRKTLVGVLSRNSLSISMASAPALGPPINEFWQPRRVKKHCESAADRLGLPASHGHLLVSIVARWASRKRTTKCSATHAVRLDTQRQIVLTEIGHRAYVTAVERLLESRPVYNLTVADTHEYYANGILVHNCDALRLGAANAVDFFIPLRRPSPDDLAAARLPEAFRPDATPEMIAALNPLAQQHYSDIQYVMMVQARDRVKKSSTTVESYQEKLKRLRRGV